MLSTKSFILLVFLCCLIKGFSQTTPSTSKPKKNTVGYYLSHTPWTIQLGGNVVDDDGKPFHDLFNASKSWNTPPYPTKLAIDKSLEHGWSAEFCFVYNNYKTGKIINGIINDASHLFISTDIQGKYHLNNIINIKEWFNPYLSIGIGYTYRKIGPYNNVATANIGVGFDFLIYQGFGINLQSLAKFGIKSPFIKTGSNYLQHSLGVTYTIGQFADKKPFKFGKRRYGFTTRKSKFHTER
jgi:hypothetical protein